MKNSKRSSSRTKKKDYSPEEIEFIRKSSNKQNIELAQKLNRSLSSIRVKRRKMGINKEFKSKYTLDLNFFTKWNKNMAFILGYIFADGSVRPLKV
jgi:hypothetical protein